MAATWASTQTVMDGYAASRAKGAGQNSLLPLPVPNHGLDAEGRSASQSVSQSSHCDTNRHAPKEIRFVRCSERMQGVLAGAVPAWIKHVLDKCWILCCRAAVCRRAQ